MNCQIALALRRVVRLSVNNLAAALLLVLISGVALSNPLFEEPFENASFSNRGWYDTSGGMLVSSVGVPNSTKAFECHFLPGATKCSGGTPGRILFQETEAVYISFWVKHSTNWVGSNKPYHPHLFYLMTNQNGSWDGMAWTRLTAYIEENAGIPRLRLQDGQNINKARIGQNLVGITELRGVTGCNGDSDGYGSGECYDCGGGDYCNGKDWNAAQVYFSNTAGPFFKGDWHKVEAFFKLNSVVNGSGVANGILRYWYDGRLIIDRNNVMMRTGQYPTMKFNQVVLSPYIGDGSPVDQTIWFDNLIIATDRPLDTLAPPVNLRIVE